MQFQINTASKVPIYRQLAEQIRSAIARGDLQPDEQLPSVRQLSKDVVVNPNTIARAYAELEHAGIVTKRHGSGTYVSDNGSPLKRAERLRILAQRADALVVEAQHLEIELSEVIDLIRERHKAMQSKD